ncbi:MAG TPA: gliding motility-associated C-terminal domain-containing protein, partial [Flavobacteriales bacterium]|nr:gliding motility-associated C-terminal domain-containing protein [Flavobacteriales bacterium]
TTITLTEPNSLIDATLSLSLYPSGTNVSCYGASDGSINATVVGGTGPYVFDWRGPDSLEFATEDIFDLPAGEYAYELVVTDANQCSFFTQVTLTQPDTSIYASDSLSQYGGYNVSCADAMNGSIDLAANGGSGGFSYAWNGPGGLTASSEDLANLAPGVYAVTITDLNGCTLTIDTTLTAPPPLVNTLVASTFPGGTNISCNGANNGSISAAVSGGVPGYGLLWSGPGGFTSDASNINDLPAGPYCLAVTDANGCTAQNCVTITEPVVLTASSTSQNADCGQPTGAVDLSASGGSTPYAYAWSNGASTEDLSAIAPGPYSVTITDVNGCTVTTSAIVAGSPGVTAGAATMQNLCNGDNEGSIDVSVNTGAAPFVYAWSTGASTEDLNDLVAGDYGLTITDANGCSFTGSWTITQGSAILIDATAHEFVNGYNVSGYQGADGSIALTVSGGTAPYTYAWSNGATSDDISGLAAGSYTVTVTDANGCSASVTVEIMEPSDLVMPTGFTPNGDGANDAFVIQGLDIYPGNTFVILNRWGSVVYDRLNYNNDWRGENTQGEQLPNGTYFAILNVNNGQRVLQGYVDLRR